MKTNIFLAALALVVATAASVVTWADDSPSRLLMSRQIAPDFRLEQIASNVYAFISNNTTHLVEDGNTTVIITDKGVVVVDAPSTFLSEKHLAEIRKLTKKPVIYLINTHSHGDHVFGNHVYRDAFPDMRIIAQDYTKEISDRVIPQQLDNLYHGQRGQHIFQAMKKAAEQGIGFDGKPLTGYDLGHAKTAFAEFAPVFQAAQRTRYVGADMTFSDNMTLTLGDTVIKLMHFVGHTKGDTAIFLPKQNILITGDLVIAPVPYGFDDFTDRWIVSLESLMAMHASVIVPGHGEVQFDNNYMQLEHDLLKSLMDQADTAASKTDDVDAFKKTVDLSAYKAKLVGNDPDNQWAWDNYFYDGAIKRAFEIAKGGV